MSFLVQLGGNVITSEPFHCSNESLPIAVMEVVGLEESGLGEFAVFISLRGLVYLDYRIVKFIQNPT